MNNTRFFSPVVMLSLAAVAVLLLALGFIAWLALSDTNIDLSGLTFRQDSRPTTVDLGSPGANAEGLAIYHQSERNVPFMQANDIGLSFYRESEWGTNSFARPNAAGLAIYQQSERNSVVPLSIEQGLAIYRQSERSAFAADPDSAKEEGMKIYYASERGR
jgi:hypothetical protein